MDRRAGCRRSCASAASRLPARGCSPKAPTRHAWRAASRWRRRWTMCWSPTRKTASRFGPSRAIRCACSCPGCEGIINIKWLRRLKVIDQPAMTRWETSKYTDLMPDGTAQNFTFEMDAKSIITRPSGGDRCPGAACTRSTGLAWSGRGIDRPRRHHHRRRRHVDEGRTPDAGRCRSRTRVSAPRGNGMDATTLIASRAPTTPATCSRRCRISSSCADELRLSQQRASCRGRYRRPARSPTGCRHVLKISTALSSPCSRSIVRRGCARKRPRSASVTPPEPTALNAIDIDVTARRPGPAAGKRHRG